MKNDKDQIKLICDVGELCGLFHGSASLEEFLQKTVEMVAQHMQSDVCSIYLFHDESQELVLSATVGLNQDFIGNVRMKLSEGLTGLSLKELRPICERNASKNDNFRYFPGLGEGKYESFLAVPIVRGQKRIGVVVIQNTVKDYFSPEDIKALQAITAQLANTIETARLILSIEEKHAERKAVLKTTDLKLVKGKVGSAGFVLARAVVLTEDMSCRLSDQGGCGDFTIEDFHKAVEETETQLNRIQGEIEEELSDVASLIFSAQILMLKDKHFIDAIIARIEDGLNPAQAVSEIVNTYVEKFNKISDHYLRERSQDVRDIGKRILANLSGKTENILNYENRVVIAQELFASDILKLFSQKVMGIILLSGGVTSHVSILAQSLKIPLIIADEPGLLDVPEDTRVLMDAELGNVYVDPSDEVIAPFHEREKTLSESMALKESILPETYTRDKIKVTLMANINLLGDLKAAHNYKAEGIGLYRTEFPFIVRSDFPSEEKQYFIYKKLVDAMPNKEVTFRTLDIGGDKVLSYFDHHAKETNPFLGMRSIRFSLKHKDIFAKQVRAILRAGEGANIRIMFPMVSSPDEFLEAKEIVLECIKSLKKEGIPCNTAPAIGMMVEIPSVVEVMDELATEADFFSIGTNDFIQYLLAVDRTNEKVSELYLPHHPAVLRALKKVIVAAQKHKKDISICGDMAHEEKYLDCLLGIGIRKISLNPDYIPRIQKAVMEIDVGKAQEFCANILKEGSIRKVSRLLDFSS